MGYRQSPWIVNPRFALSGCDESHPVLIVTGFTKNGIAVRTSPIVALVESQCGFILETHNGRRWFLEEVPR